MEKNRIKSQIYRLSNLIDAHSARNDGLSGGKTGIAYSKFYIGKYFEDEAETNKGIQFINEVLNNLNTEVSTINDSTFLNGLSGVLSVINLLKINELIDFDMQDFAVYDQLIYKYAMGQIEQNNFDFFYGSMGAFSYLVDRMPDKRIEIFVNEISNAICYKINESSIPNAIINVMYNALDKRANLEVNFGLAHGMGSVIINLLKYLSAKPENEMVRNTLANVINNIVDLNKEYTSNIPYLRFIDTYNFETKKNLYQGRLGWCGGDLNALHLLYYGSNILNCPDWHNFANKDVDKITGRSSPNETLNYDPFLCHGHLGVAQYYLILSKLSGNSIFNDAAEASFKKGIEFLEGVDNGYFFTPPFTRYAHIHSFLYGAPGAILCLLSAYDKAAHNWSKIILL